MIFQIGGELGGPNKSESSLIRCINILFLKDSHKPRCNPFGLVKRHRLALVGLRVSFDGLALVVNLGEWKLGTILLRMQSLLT